MKSSLFTVFPTIALSLTLAACGASPAPATAGSPGGQQTTALTFSAS